MISFRANFVQLIQLSALYAEVDLESPEYLRLLGLHLETTFPPEPPPRLDLVSEVHVSL